MKINRQPTHPGKILREEFLIPLKITQTKLAEDLEVSTKIISEILNRRKDINPELALKLSRYFETSAELWLNLQNQYDIQSVLKNKKKEIHRIRPYKVSA